MRQLTKEELEKLLYRMELFKCMGIGNDLVSIGVEGKRPFGNSHIEGDILEILKIESLELKSDTGKVISTLQEKDIIEIMKQLANFINEKLGIVAKKEFIGRKYQEIETGEHFKIFNIDGKYYKCKILDGKDKGKKMYMPVRGFESKDFQNKFKLIK